MTGLYPQNNGSLAFDPIRSGIPTLSKILKDNGYVTCVLGKEGHYRPYESYDWTRTVPANKLGHGCNTELYVDNIKDFLRTHKGQKFFIHANSHEPHRPYKECWYDKHHIKLPSFLPVNWAISEDLARYYTSVNKFDIMAKVIVEAIKECTDEPILWVITSDHGMSFPYCKGNCYNFSNNVPMIFVGPNIKKHHDHTNLVSHVDFTPTMLDYLGINVPGFDGIPYKKILTGEADKFEREYIYMQFNKFVEPRSVFHCRALANLNYCYTYNFTVKYPVWEVDGWGWDFVVKHLNNYQLHEFVNRRQEEPV